MEGHAGIEPASNASKAMILSVEIMTLMFGAQSEDRTLHNLFVGEAASPAALTGRLFFIH
jgi:hypothetical protein